MKRQFKPVSKKVEQQRAPLFDAPSPETVNMVMSHLSDLLGLGALFTIAKLAKTLAKPVRGTPSAQTDRKNVEPPKATGPEDSLLAKLTTVVTQGVKPVPSASLLPAKSTLKAFILASAAKACAAGVPAFNRRHQLEDMSGFVAARKRFAFFREP